MAKTIAGSQLPPSPLIDRNKVYVDSIRTATIKQLAKQGIAVPSALATRVDRWEGPLLPVGNGTPGKVVHVPDGALTLEEVAAVDALPNSPALAALQQVFEVPKSTTSVEVAPFQNLRFSIENGRVIGTLAADPATQEIYSKRGVSLSVVASLDYSQPVATGEKWPAFDNLGLSLSLPPGYTAMVKAVDNQDPKTYGVRRIEDFEWVSGTSEINTNSAITAALKAGTGLWVQVFDSLGTRVDSKRVSVGPVSFSPVDSGGLTVGTRVDEWRTAEGKVIAQPASLYPTVR